MNAMGKKDRIITMTISILAILISLTSIYLRLFVPVKT